MELENNVEKNDITLKKYVNRLKKREGITFLVLVTMIILFLIILSITLPPIILWNRKTYFGNRKSYCYYI